MNVIGVTNAGKRNYGANHWFWAVWCELGESPEWNGEEPADSGFCDSRPTARRAAWNSLSAHVTSRNRRAYLRDGWAWSYLAKQDEDDQRPSFSRCKVGKDKWLWVVHSLDGIFDDQEPIARGFAESAEATHETAVETIGPVQQCGNWMADHVRQKDAAIKRSQKPVNTDSASQLEFAYECHPWWSDYDGGQTDLVRKHRIVKKTKTRVYVEREPYRQDGTCSGNWRDFVVSTFVLDREEFETTGKADRSGRWHGTYYADPAIYHSERRSTAFQPECLVGLGVPSNATAAEIRLAYKRLARRSHPDAGGDEEQFKQVREWYDQAMAMVA